MPLALAAASASTVRLLIASRSCPVTPGTDGEKKRDRPLGAASVTHNTGEANAMGVRPQPSARGPPHAYRQAGLRARVVRDLTKRMAHSRRGVHMLKKRPGASPLNPKK